MKRLILLSTAIIFTAMLWSGQSVHAQTAETHQEDPRTKRTPEEKEYYRLFDTPENQLSLDDQLLKYRIYLLTGKNFYIKNGELKTRCTVKDFVRIGAKPSMYKVFVKELKGTNDFFTEHGNPSVAERTAMFEKSIKNSEDALKKFAEKIAELEKRKAAQ